MPYARRRTMARGRPTRRKRAFTRPARKALPYKYKTAITTAVKRVVSRGRENKRAAWALRPTTIPAIIGTTQSFNVFRVMPEIEQGTSMFGARVGNKICPKYMTVKGYCTLDMTDSNRDYDRVGVRLFLGFVKQYPLYEDANAVLTGSPLDNWSYRLLDYAGQPGKFDGTLNALQAPINNRMWHSLGERRFTLMRPRIWDAPLTGDDFARSTAGSYKFFSFRVKVPKVLQYSTDLDVRAKNFAPVLLAGYSLLNGAAPSNPITDPKQVTISFTSNVVYEDA